ncbi:hypothetical protein DQT32_03875 [Salmonella enterica subsp. enterica serovar Braenderup]|nr:hypothetical protein [Salmonella enterica subsp. enterica serovar Braenderup]
MASEFIHFGTFGQKKETKPAVDIHVTGTTNQDFNEVTDRVAAAIQKMIDEGKESGELCIEMPDDLSPEEAAQFIDAVMQRIFNQWDDEDDE